MAKKKKEKSGALALDVESNERLKRLRDQTGLPPAEVIAMALKFWEEHTQPGQTDPLVASMRKVVREELKSITLNSDAASSTPLTEDGERAALPPQEREALIQEALKLRQEGQSWNRIAENFNRRGQATLSGVGKWHGQTLGNWMRRETSESS
ncbi:hypothetical protein [Magnetofaba australis]|uniref:Uncharacterized protein n=1 Tax=Magnetofaba australis IT-1 TaxID=1434232 RepID=A0A1Y2K4J5_9PROT|nr:hypothetical protein [Magnetofaba australis]OSM02566.1 hypothetical protein MAIT1_02736 [Magnetofaba australis IT-1]